MKVNWLITDKNVTVNYNGQTHIISRDNKMAENIFNAIKTKDFDVIPNFVDIAERIEKESNSKFIVKNGAVYIDGVKAPPYLGNKIVQFSNEGLPYEPLVKFAQNLQNNPSFRAVNELFMFLEKNDHPITEDGKFIAYKKVGSDFKDLHSGTFDNSVGNVVEMPRNEVNEDPNQTCSTGLHVANWNYAQNIYHSGSSNTILLEVEVDPADVVAVPIDYNSAKMRVCRYVVLNVVEQESSDVLRANVNDDDCEDLDDDEDFDEDADDDHDDYLDEEEEEDRQERLEKEANRVGRCCCHGCVNK